MENSEKRKRRIFKILNSIKECNIKGFGTNKEKLIATIGIEFGIARRTCLEYINNLLISGKIFIKNEELFVTKEDAQ